MRTNGRGAGGWGRAGGPLPRLLALLLLAASAGCDFLDPTEVENPRTTDEDLAAAGEPTQAFLSGLRAQFARMIGSQIVISEVTSDNYSIHGTGLPPVWDFARDIRPSDVNLTGSGTGIYWNMQELRALADFVLERIVPGDADATPAHRAEIHYYRGMAFLLLGENFTHAPTEKDGEPRSASELLQRAITDFDASLAASGEGTFALAARAGIARAQRALGNAGAAIAAAQQVLDADASFVFQQHFDATSIQNQPHIFLVVRQLQEMQPLPRLDFLDPKYLSRSAPIAVAKAEEMHLIMAEAALAEDDLLTARGHLRDAIELALSRGTTPFIDEDPRLNGDLTIRPRDSEIVVRADPTSPFRAGLILDRPGVEIPVPTISGTSLDPDSVFALTQADDIWHAFHLARQEIMLLEGRRMSDLGIRLPIMLREIEQNPSISEGDPGTVVVVPSYIPPGQEMKLFDPQSPYDVDENLVTTQVTILHDMNRRLTDNRVNAFLN
ncbi:MAG: hypothetical protein KY466_04130 [Gemmatimonadetes bacterium]|nr:hypothetical protein [Gemmatimonadota bacterium]